MCPFALDGEPQGDLHLDKMSPIVASSSSPVHSVSHVTHGPSHIYSASQSFDKLSVLMPSTRLFSERDKSRDSSRGSESSGRYRKGSFDYWISQTLSCRRGSLKLFQSGGKILLDHGKSSADINTVMEHFVLETNKEFIVTKVVGSQDHCGLQEGDLLGVNLFNFFPTKDREFFEKSVLSFECSYAQFPYILRNDFIWNYLSKFLGRYFYISVCASSRTTYTFKFDSYVPDISPIHLSLSFNARTSQFLEDDYSLNKRILAGLPISELLTNFFIDWLHGGKAAYETLLRDYYCWIEKLRTVTNLLVPTSPSIDVDSSDDPSNLEECSFTARSAQCSPVIYCDALGPLSGTGKSSDANQGRIQFKRIVQLVDTCYFAELSLYPSNVEDQLCETVGVHITIPLIDSCHCTFLGASNSPVSVKGESPGSPVFTSSFSPLNVQMKDFLVLKQLGKGSYGQVILAKPRASVAEMSFAATSSLQRRHSFKVPRNNEPTESSGPALRDRILRVTLEPNRIIKNICKDQIPDSLMIQLRPGFASSSRHSELRLSPTDVSPSSFLLPLEIFILEKLRPFHHRYLLSYEGYFEDSKNFYIVSSSFGKVDLFEFIESQKPVPVPGSMQIPGRSSTSLDDTSPALPSHTSINGPCLPIPSIRRIFFQILRGVEFLHSKGIVHRDLKDENIIIDPIKLNIKIIDFGSARFLNSSTCPFGQQSLDIPSAADWIGDVVVGTMEFLPPELLFLVQASLDRDPPSAASWSQLVAQLPPCITAATSSSLYTGKEQDIWALGILLLIMLFKASPFKNVDNILQFAIHHCCKHSNDARTVNLLKDLCPSSSLDPLFVDLLNGALDPNPFTRLSAKHLLNLYDLHTNPNR